MEDQTRQRFLLIGMGLFSILLMIIGGFGTFGRYTLSMDYRLAFDILLSIGSVGFIISSIWLAAIAIMRETAATTSKKVSIVSSKD